MRILEKEILQILKRLESKVDRVEGKVDKLESKVDKLESKVDKLESKVDKLESKVDKLEGKVDKLEGKVDENTLILRALEHSSEVNRAEHDKMSNDIVHINGNVEAIKKDITNVEVITASNWQDIARLKAVK